MIETGTWATCWNRRCVDAYRTRPTDYGRIRELAVRHGVSIVDDALKELAARLENLETLIRVVVADVATE